jgi:hypothetical protein
VTGRVAAVVVALVPFLLGASVSDPRGDTAPCRGGVATPDLAVDLIGADAMATEGGSAIRFTMTFAASLRVPDTEGRPFRVDVLVRDPEVPAVSFEYLRDVNRIIRFDAVGGPGVAILLLPERGTNTFLGASVDGSVLTIELPGRLLTRDDDLAGPALERLRWSVVARDERSCDFLGDGRPTLQVAPASPIAQASPTATPATAPSDPPGWVPALAVFGTIAGLWAYASFSRRRAMRR